MSKFWVKVSDIILPCKCLHAKKSSTTGMYYPCGKCLWCRQKLSREWSIRLGEESKNKFCYSGLLSYDPVHVPMYKGEYSLNKVHLQLFMKRYRYHLNKIFGTKVKFFCAGEYGGNTHRPHYHIMLFSDVDLFSKDSRKLKRGEIPLSKQLLLDCWSYGGVNIEKMTNANASAIYLTQYLVGHHDSREYDKHNKPFTLMSRRPALGVQFLEREKKLINWMQETGNYVYKQNGYTKPLPRYYKRKIMPEEIQIETADKYFDACREYENYLKSLTPKEQFDYANKKRNLQCEQLGEQKRRYRETKIHEHNRCAGIAFKRINA